MSKVPCFKRRDENDIKNAICIALANFAQGDKYPKPQNGQVWITIEACGRLLIKVFQKGESWYPPHWTQEHINNMKDDCVDDDVNIVVEGFPGTYTRECLENSDFYRKNTSVFANQSIIQMVRFPASLLEMALSEFNPNTKFM